MKVLNAFAQLFAVFAFLMLGSLLMLVAFHLLSFDDAVFKLKEIYDSTWRSSQVGFVGLLFIVVGLAFSKILVKMGRQTEAVIFQSERGPMVVSAAAIKDVAKKITKRFPLVKESKVKVLIHAKKVEVKLRLVLWSGGQVPVILESLQGEIQDRVKKLLGAENQVEINCDVKKIVQSESEIDMTEV